MNTLICTALDSGCDGNHLITYIQYFNTSVRKLAVTSLCSFDLLKLPSSSSLNPLILLGKSVYGGQDSLQDIKSCIHVVLLTLKSAHIALH
jgi:hypothetical protein